MSNLSMPTAVHATQGLPVGSGVKPHQRQRFIWMVLITITAVYFLILVGGTVRATGAGMGCPDWPLCFGQLVPPTHESQLPSDWRVRYADRGYDTADFDPVKTWTEYVNRLVGATIGILAILTVLAARPFRREQPVVFWSSLGGLLFIGFNGWLGSMVVASNLRPVMISAHMVGAFLVQMCFIYAVVRAAGPEALLTERSPQSQTLRELPRWFRGLVLATLAALTLQIFLGIQIRESVDLISRMATELSRDQWLEAVPWIFLVHRSFSWVILGLCLYLLMRVYQSPLRRTRAGFMASLLVGFTAFEMALGGALNHLGFPLIAQPVHLLTAHLMFGLLWFLYTVVSPSFSGVHPSHPNHSKTMDLQHV
ncbi:MAG: COX15/CtaA family protein [Burkholderiaceae bacterium]